MKPLVGRAGFIVIGMALHLPTSGVAQTFEEVARSIGIEHFCFDSNRIGGGVAVFDYNNDGHQDLYLTGCLEPDRLFENEGDGKFRDVTKRAGLDAMKDINTVGVATADIDNDGDRDIFVTTAEGFTNVLLRNNGDGTFTDISQSAGIIGNDWSTMVTFGDFDLDGLLDMYVGNYATYDALPYDENLTGGFLNQLYHNRGNGTFEEVAALTGVDGPSAPTLSVTFSDFDGDYDVDLFVGNDFGDLFEPNRLFVNEYPDLHFTDFSEASATDTAINAMGFAVGDYDEDGDLDYFVTNMMGNVLYQNAGGRSAFAELGRVKGIDDEPLTSWGTAFLDYDNDTYLDLAVANGRVLSRYDLAATDHVDRFLASHINKLYRNDGRGDFIDVSEPEGIADSTRGRGLAYGDLDNDGDLDLVVAVLSHLENTPAQSLVYRNRGDESNHWLQVAVQGTINNRDGFGSRVRLVAGGRSFLREIGGGTSYLSQNQTIAHFGLGPLTAADSVIVTWPGGEEDVVVEVDADQRILIVEGTSPRGSSNPMDEP